MNESSDVRKVFEYYCSYGDPLNTTTMGPVKFYKFCRDAKFVSSGSLRQFDVETALQFARRKLNDIRALQCLFSIYRIAFHGIS